MSYQDEWLDQPIRDASVARRPAIPGGRDDRGMAPPSDRRYYNEHDDRGRGGSRYDDRHDDRRGRYDDRDRGRRDYDDRDRDRRRDYDDRGRDRDRDRERRPRSGFQDMPPPGIALAPGQPGMPQPGMLLPGFNAPLNPARPNMPVMAAPSINPKKQRELYIGNVPTGAVNEAMFKELFGRLLEQCDGYQHGGPPVLNVQLRGGTSSSTGAGTTFAFVEFRDEVLSETVATFNGMELYGRNLKISHPNGYVEPPVPVKILGVPQEIRDRFGLGSYEAMRRQDQPPADLADRKSRELYVGNLTIGMVNSAMLIELFTYPLQKLPLGENGQGVQVPVVEAKVDASGKYAFVLFHDDQIATMALAIFNKMELCGRPLCVDRPAGYAPEMSRPLPPGMLEHGMPSGGTGAPPDKAARAAAQTAAITGIVPSEMPLGAAFSSAAPGPSQSDPPSKLLCLKNLLGPEALADEAEWKDCTEDITEECKGFGNIVSCVFPRPGELHGYTEEDVGSCFVKYELMSSAVKAQSDLDGRDFDNRKVSATFVQESVAPAAIGSS
jgi:hypothetical protein